MGGWNDLDPGIWVVGSELELALKSFSFFVLIDAKNPFKSLPTEFLILTKNLDPQLVAPWAENRIAAL